MVWIKRGMMLLMAISLITLFGCRMPPKPRIENTYYKNFEYEFKTKIPSGWTAHKFMPDDLEDTVAAEFADDFVFMLTNADTEGIIVITADKSDYDILTIGYNKDAFKEQLTAQLTAQEEAYTKDGTYENYSYEIYPLSVTAGYGPTLIYSETGQRPAGDQFVRAVLLNKCQEDETCAINITLITKQDTYDYNFGVFSDVINSTIKVYQK